MAHQSQQQNNNNNNNSNLIWYLSSFSDLFAASQRFFLGSHLAKSHGQTKPPNFNNNNNNRKKTKKNH
jgi:hypothetical protein